jgi:hypothetical protein
MLPCKGSEESLAFCNAAVCFATKLILQYETAFVKQFFLVFIPKLGYNKAVSVVSKAGEV